MANFKKKLIEDYLEQALNDDTWDLGNNVLYDLCKNNFYHKRNSEIIAKIWLIGRAYSASLDSLRQISS